LTVTCTTGWSPGVGHVWCRLGVGSASGKLLLGCSRCEQWGTELRQL
jgi:hypothetical protein